ncbi:glycosyltransferase [Sulfuracidifex metallicus DSM 6482 = JCM 9184]|uniref:Glycosyltransferase n=2 Tax=Sulfuracidifex metallicus TaxID=47303 RepID=A0A6A9QHN8_SULME|nr:glycosyltransferase [Sulfuracidifex metallicus DSM 6482 = JCM 9184]WOE50947.1 glycosyltransferase [Sulfuracidifex metallicus DSM 6482 = JCM 9184]
MPYTLKIRAPNIFMKNYIGGAEYVTLNWLTRFKKIDYEIIPDMDLIYLDLCINKKIQKDNILEIIDKLKLPINTRLLNYYLDCKLHNNPDIFKKVLNNEIVLDMKIGTNVNVSQFLNKHILEFIRRRPVGYDFLHYSLKYSKKYIGMLQHLGDIPLSLNFYIYYFKKLLGYIDSFTELIYLLASVIRQKTWVYALIHYKDKVHLLAPSKGVIKKVGLNKLNHTIIFPYVGLDSSILNYACKNKDDYAVFFARSYRTKGILDAIKIFKLAKERGYLRKLYIIGGNINDITSKYSNETDIISLGRINDKNEVYRILSKAKVNIYPSISDAFGITILESLGVYTPVVMYYNEANYEYFSKSKLVKIVNSFDKYEFLNKINEIIKGNKVEIDGYTNNLIRSHLDWNKIVNNIEEHLLNIIENIR